MTPDEILTRIRALYRTLPRDDMNRKSQEYDAIVKQIRVLADAYRAATQK